ncbi:MAG: alkaline phosphatase D family protein [bacterium]
MTDNPRRRDVLRAGLAGAALLAAPRRAPAVIAGGEPATQWGVAAGDVTPDGAVVWSRTDRPSRMHVEWSVDPGFRRHVRQAGFSEALETSDFCAQVPITGLPADRRIHYRAMFENLETGAMSAPVAGSLLTPQLRPGRPLKFAWSGDVGGQGYGINPDLGGMRIFDVMRGHQPDFFIHCGDMIYADSVYQAKKGAKGGGGRAWTNLITPEKLKVAETQKEFWGNFRYNLLDDNLRRFYAEVPLVVQWDDHETKNNWWPGRMLDEDDRYTVKSCSLLSARARKAFFDYNPIAVAEGHVGRIYRTLPQGPLADLFVLDARSYRAPNNENQQSKLGPDTAFFGGNQLRWLARGLKQSQATWKVIVCDQPICLMVAHGQYTFEGIANGSGPARGRELEIAWLLSFIKRQGIKNVVWLTADVHYAASHHYHPDRASYTDFNPFYEFVSGPLNAATFGPNRLDKTFGAKVDWHGIPDGTPFGASPFLGLQFFGLVEIDPVSQALTVTHYNLEGRKLSETRLEAGS